jgi:hypothetical protein
MMVQVIILIGIYSKSCFCIELDLKKVQATKVAVN